MIENKQKNTIILKLAVLVWFAAIMLCALPFASALDATSDAVSEEEAPPAQPQETAVECTDALNGPRVCHFE